MKKQKYEREKDCFCHTCGKEYHHLGIASHRAIHRRKQEDCKITYSNGITATHGFSKHFVKHHKNTVWEEVKR